ncbi:hypothetical protein DFH08DRAFT_825112 [Mycena albidolilacea]|uniref:Uncharacterized protein n=1 Tax=Mycena albidolilacea TaxID=1033008 RepID=A0AAD6Z3U3_9AGAR|nr:hypothetical protein DFH08DRAFT_825112 [Mycena albidolilacea]
MHFFKTVLLASALFTVAHASLKLGTGELSLVYGAHDIKDPTLSAGTSINGDPENQFSSNILNPNIQWVITDRRETPQETLRQRNIQDVSGSQIDVDTSSYTKPSLQTQLRLECSAVFELNLGLGTCKWPLGDNGSDFDKALVFSCPQLVLREWGWVSASSEWDVRQCANLPKCPPGFNMVSLSGIHNAF